MDTDGKERLYFHENRYWDRGMLAVAGVDEAGRGSLAGPVVAAAVILPPYCFIDGLRDSKKMKAAEREYILEIIRGMSLAIGYAAVPPDEIDRINILQATLLAMKEAVMTLCRAPEFVIVDGNRLPAWKWRSEALIRGDSLSHCVAAASVVAKVERDRLMTALDERNSGYHFSRHKGYGTPEHIEAIRSLGLSPIHRKTFCRNIQRSGTQTTIEG